MLLPSAFSCDPSHSSRPPLTRLQASLFSSPPASPPHLSAQHAIGNIFSSCRSLQSMLAAPAPIVGPISPPTSSHAQLPTPPMTYTPAPMKLRLRSHRAAETTGLGITTGEPVKTRKRIVKRAPARGPNKRRRAVDDDLGRDDEDVESDLDIMNTETDEIEAPEETEVPRPSTPKRARIAPEVLPLGLERSDYHALDTNINEEGTRGTDVVLEADGEAWSAEDDRILVELVLEKLKLSKSDWQDCARSLGKHSSSLGRRWKSLVISGDVGLKRSSRRSKIHGTWR